MIPFFHTDVKKSFKNDFFLELSVIKEMSNIMPQVYHGAGMTKLGP